MLRRGLLLTLLFLPLAATPALGDVHSHKESVDAKIAGLNAKIARAHAKEGILTGQISQVTSRIRSLQSSVDSAQGRLDSLRRVLGLHQEKLYALARVYALQTEQYRFLRGQYAIASARLNRRLVDLYESERPDTLAVVLSASDFSGLLDQLEYLRQIGAQDHDIADTVASARDRMRATRARTKQTRDAVARVTHQIAAKTYEQQKVAERLLASQNSLRAARQDKQSRLASTQESEKEYLNEVNGLQAASARLAARLRSSASSTSSGPVDSSPSSSGLIWPVSGPITSPFGWRWGRMHEGIDIGVSYGTPIHAAASGTVVYCGWEGGYGNLVVIDHGGGLATAYGHQSSIAASCGQHVGQGEVVGYVGCTGHCFGPHLHFEVRINGSPVDPLGYL
jgi:murein DD-endopeptidase MepM/ murein hydrolase activator NlpD